MRLCQKMQRMLWVASAIALSLCSYPAIAAENSPQVALNVSKTGPRAVETLTQRAIVRDYKFAWANFALAMESNSASPVNGLFVGNAIGWINEGLSAQRRSGLTSRDLNQSHKVEAVFYSPEGDVIELHDTAEYDYSILDGGKTIHNERAVVHYVVLMTPGEERWVIRQLQAVPQF